MNVLITGYKGFIGSHIYSSLKSEEIKLHGFDLGDKLGGERYDIIFHLAARGLIRKSIEMPYEYFQDNLDLTLKFLETARKNDSAIVFPTSGSVAEPSNPYSMAKQHSVDWIRLYGKLYGIKYYILKFYNIYGSGSRKGAVYLFTKAALNKEKIVVYGDGTHVRDFLNVSDVVKGCRMILNGQLKPGEHEFGSGIGTSVNSLISKIENITGNTLEVQHDDYVVDEAEALTAKNPVIKDPVKLEDGIKQVIDFIRKNRA